MRRLCPSLTELQAFEATARHLSFTRAAGELFVTQGAVSRQVAKLEAYLGVALFTRANQRLVLSGAGRGYLPSVRAALGQLENATAHILANQNAGGVLNLSVPPTFSMQWMLPRLQSFYSAHPDISLNFVRYRHTHNFFQDEDLDAAIQFGEGQWPGAASYYLTGRDGVTVARPQLFGGVSSAAPADLVRATLLQHVEVPYAWQDWCSGVGVRHSNSLVGPRFDQYSLIIKAALAGLGVGLVPHCLVEDELREGRLVVPCPQPFQARQGYFLCVKEDREAMPAALHLLGWLLAHLHASDAA